MRGKAAAGDGFCAGKLLQGRGFARESGCRGRVLSGKAAAGDGSHVPAGVIVSSCFFLAFMMLGSVAYLRGC